MAKKQTKKTTKKVRRVKLKLWLMRELHGYQNNNPYYQFTIAHKAPKLVHGGWTSTEWIKLLCPKQWESWLSARSKYRLKRGKGPVEVKLVE